MENDLTPEEQAENRKAFEEFSAELLAGFERQALEECNKRNGY